MRIGITGHRGLDERLRHQVTALLTQVLDTYEGRSLDAVTCLADGPDTWLADLVLDRGGRLIVIVPAADYRTGLPAWHHGDYDRLLARAADVYATGLTDSTGQAHMAAGEILVGHCDVLLAVWDGLPARGHGGTADVVAHADSVGVKTLVLWPDGASRPTR
ncbi:hypothetical protein [Streptomyces sp. CBMA156]|uniref:hypothetical protein n=1 Tax=Streptomyces sp. CBMA156 TaxID=1930280 RepID=UPI001661E49B|nr:hypothetical protein [Streptomyces sp. CBMA156]MBD0670401.1 hypothetical protein [Streptomyces sp. CBMA156]